MVQLLDVKGSTCSSAICTEKIWIKVTERESLIINILLILCSFFITLLRNCYSFTDLTKLKYTYLITDKQYLHVLCHHYGQS